MRSPRSSLLVAVALTAACHAGGGPVVAIGRGGRTSIQAEAGGGVAFLRSDLAVDLYDTEGRRGGLVSLGAWSFADEVPERAIGVIRGCGPSS